MIFLDDLFFSNVPEFFPSADAISSRQNQIGQKRGFYVKFRTETGGGREGTSALVLVKRRFFLFTGLRGQGNTFLSYSLPRFSSFEYNIFI